MAKKCSSKSSGNSSSNRTRGPKVIFIEFAKLHFMANVTSGITVRKTRLGQKLVLESKGLRQCGDWAVSPKHYVATFEIRAQPGTYVAVSLHNPISRFSFRIVIITPVLPPV